MEFTSRYFFLWYDIISRVKFIGRAQWDRTGDIRDFWKLTGGNSLPADSSAGFWSTNVVSEFEGVYLANCNLVSNFIWMGAGVASASLHGRSKKFYYFPQCPDRLWSSAIVLSKRESVSTSQRVKRLGLDADHLVPRPRCVVTPPYVFVTWCLIN
jgi:hypothetical protein